MTLLSITACSPSRSGATKAISSKPAATTGQRPPREAESDAHESIQLMTVPPKAVPCMLVWDGNTVSTCGCEREVIQVKHAAARVGAN